MEQGVSQSGIRVTYEDLDTNPDAKARFEKDRDVEDCSTD